MEILCREMEEDPNIEVHCAGCNNTLMWTTFEQVSGIMSYTCPFCDYNWKRNKNAPTE